jgi:hypothetical protein
MQVPMNMPWTSNALLSRTLLRFTRVAGDGELMYRYQCIRLGHQRDRYPDHYLDIQVTACDGELR